MTMGEVKGGPPWPLAVSNIAWAGNPDEPFLNLLAEEGAQGVEVAASLVWPEPVQSTRSERRQWRRNVESRQLRIIGLHALLYSRRDLRLLEEGVARQRVRDYLLRMLDVCIDLGGKCLVLGSPDNRRRNGLAYAEARKRIVSLLSELARKADEAGCYFALETLPVSLCDFITTFEEAADIVRTVNSSGLRLHFDTGAASSTVSDEDTSVIALLNCAAHCHVNDPILLPPGLKEPEKHDRWARLLRQAAYRGWLSIEMRRRDAPETAIRRAIRFVAATYGVGSHPARAGARQRPS